MDVMVRRIEPSRGWALPDLRDLWRHRQLVRFLVWRDIKIRYKQTLLGITWAVIQPLMLMVVFTVVFHRIADVPSQGVPAPVFSYSGLVPWTFFATALGAASQSLVANSSILTKVYFPRLALPVAGIGAAFVDAGVASLMLFVLLALFSVSLSMTAVVVPLFFLLAACSALGIGLIFAAINVHFRDVRYGLPFLIQLWLFASPVAYPSSMIDESVLPFYSLNPMVAVVDGVRWALLGTPAPTAESVGLGVTTAFLSLVIGAFLFRRVERSFADVV